MPWTNRPSNCRAHIEKAVCVVGPSDENENVLQRKCLGGEEKYVLIFQNIYDNFNPVLKKMFCSLRKIYIEEEFFATAYAQELIGENNKSEGAIMGLRKTILDKGMNLSHWASWKDQLNFGGEKLPDSPIINTGLPHYAVEFKDKSINDLVYFVVVHEFGHFLDYANGVNQFAWDQCADDAKECHSRENTWSSLSWKSNKEPHPTDSFPLQKKLCFYGCKDQFIYSNQFQDLFSSLVKTSFISNYAATNPWDDFAETVAYYVTDKEVGFSFDLNIPNGESIDMAQRLYDPVLAKKLRYLDDFFSDPDLQYP